MKRPVAAVSIVLVLFSSVFSYVPSSIGVEDQGISFTIQMSVTYSNRGTETWNLTEEDRTISLFMNNTWQTVSLTNHSHPVEETKTDRDGNPTAVLEFPKLALNPNETINFNFTYQVLSKPRLLPSINEESGTLDQVPTDLREEFNETEGPWLVNDSSLRDLAYYLAENETRVLTILRKYVEWINEYIDYPKEPQEGPLYPNETYLQREGDCDDQAILLITLCRILGIPAYLQVGCIYTPETQFKNNTYWEGHLASVLKRIAWHGWAMVYVPPWEWLPVDLTYVWGGSANPLDAIRRSAVTSQRVIQYANVIRTSYVAAYWEARAFLQNNKFYIYTQDEMNTETNEIIANWWLRFTIIGITVTLAITAALVFDTRIRRKPTR